MGLVERETKFNLPTTASRGSRELLTGKSRRLYGEEELRKNLQPKGTVCVTEGAEG